MDSTAVDTKRPHAEEADSAVKRARTDMSDKSFELSITCLNNCNQLLDIISNVEEVRLHDAVRFDIIHTDSAKGIMVSHASSCMLFSAFLECKVEYLDTSSEAHSFFVVSISKFAGLMKSIKPEYVIKIFRYKGSAKVETQAFRPGTLHMEQAFKLNEIDTNAANEHGRFLSNMIFPTTIVMHSTDLKRTLQNMITLKIYDLHVEMRKLKDGQGNTVNEFSIFGDDEINDVHVVTTRKMIETEQEDGSHVCNYDAFCDKDSLQLVEKVSVVYNTSVVFDIIRNMKQSINMCFGAYQVRNEETGEVEDMANAKTLPLFISLRMGDTSSWMRFLLTNKTTEDDSDAEM